MEITRTDWNGICRQADLFHLLTKDVAEQSLVHEPRLILCKLVWDHLIHLYSGLYGKRIGGERRRDWALNAMKKVNDKFNSSD